MGGCAVLVSARAAGNRGVRGCRCRVSVCVPRCVVDLASVTALLRGTSGVQPRDSEQ